MKHKFTLIVLLSTCLTVFHTQITFAWGSTGHRVIAEIAERHLNTKAKKNIYKIIGKQKLAYWSNWADFIKSDPDSVLNTTGSWHFVNTNADLSFTQFNFELQQSKDINLYKSYVRIKEKAKTDKDLSIIERQKNLYYLIHLFADAHQPMHVSRERDLGGNKIAVFFFGKKTNIHRVWDSDLIDHEKYSYTEYANVLDIHDHKIYQPYLDCTFEEMLFQSHELANKIYADVARNPNLSYSYIYAYKYAMEDCLLKAGVRLAAQLNEIYGR